MEYSYLNVKNNLQLMGFTAIKKSLGQLYLSSDTESLLFSAEQWASSFLRKAILVTVQQIQSTYVF